MFDDVIGKLFDGYIEQFRIRIIFCTVGKDTDKIFVESLVPS